MTRARWFCRYCGRVTSSVHRVCSDHRDLPGLDEPPADPLEIAAHAERRAIGRQCEACGGSGVEWPNDECWHCAGTGVFTKQAARMGEVPSTREGSVN